VPLAARVRRHRTILIVGGVLLLVAGTFGIRKLREHRQNLPQIAEQNTADGLVALELGDFDIAKSKLARAARALEELGDEDAPKIRQNAKEAAILADLASSSLEEIVEDVATREQGPSNFTTLYKGRSVLLEAKIAALPDPNGAHGYELDYLILGGAGSRPKRGRIDLIGFRLFADAGPKVGDTVTFGGRLQAVTLGDDGVWRVLLAPDSGVRIVSTQAWKALESLEFYPPTAGEDAK
jgi:hypothetical protein